MTEKDGYLTPGLRRVLWALLLFICWAVVFAFGLGVYLALGII